MPSKERRVENRGPEARRTFTPQFIGQIILYLVAGGSVGGGIAYLAPTNAQLDLRVDEVEARTMQNEANLKQMDLHVGDYIKSHAREEQLKDHLFEEKLNRVNDQLDRIESDIKEIKEFVRNSP